MEKGYLMDYNIIKTNAENAFKYYKSDDKKYTDSMKNLYSEGNKNPSVTSIILDNTINNSIGKMSDLSQEMIDGARVPSILPSFDHFEQMADFEARTNIALLAMKKGINASEIQTDKNIQKLPEKQEFDKRFNELYPKTGEIRKRTIDAHRIKMDKVTPKANWSDKIMYAKTNKEYKEMYPKSFLTRATLIMKNQIKDNEVTKRVSGFFRRLSYYPFVDNSFRFLK